MRKIILTMAFSMPMLAFGQAATSDALVGVNTTIVATNSTKQLVESSAQTSLLSSMGVAMASLEKADARLKKAMEQADWIRNLQTAKKLYMMIETVVCTYQDITEMATRQGRLSNCFFSFEYQYSMIQLQSAIDMMGVLLATGRSMTAGERMTSLNNSLDQFGKAHKTLNALNNQLLNADLISLLNKNRSKSFKQLMGLRIK